MMLLKTAILLASLSLSHTAWATLPCATDGEMQKTLEIAKGLLEQAERDEATAKEKVNQIQGALDRTSDKNPDKPKIEAALAKAKNDLAAAEAAKAFKKNNYDGYKSKMQPSLKGNLDKSCTAGPVENSDGKQPLSAERKRWLEEGKFEVQTPDGKVTVSVPAETRGLYERLAADGHMSPAEMRATGVSVIDAKGNTLQYQGNTNAAGTGIGHTFGTGDGARTYVDPDGIGTSSTGAFHSANDLSGVNRFVSDAALTRATALQATTNISQAAPNGAKNYVAPIDNFYTKMNPDGSTTLVPRTGDPIDTKRGFAAPVSSTNEALTKLGSLLPASNKPANPAPDARGFAAEVLDLKQCGTALQCK